LSAALDLFLRQWRNGSSSVSNFVEATGMSGLVALFVHHSGWFYRPFLAKDGTCPFSLPNMLCLRRSWWVADNTASRAGAGHLFLPASLLSVYCFKDTAYIHDVSHRFTCVGACMIISEYQISIVSFWVNTDMHVSLHCNNSVLLLFLQL
jgi:hypothetical protein